MMLGIILLYVGAALIINGLTMLGKISQRESAIINLFTGSISALVCMHGAFVGGTDGQIQSCAYGLLFAFSFLWIAYNNWTQQDGRGLGWFSLFVAITAAAITIDQLSLANSFAGQWLTLCWAIWSLLWAGFFINHIVHPLRYLRPLAYSAIAAGIVTGWLPGYFILSGHMPS